VTKDEELYAAALAVADALGESDATARHSIAMIVRQMGLAFALEHMERALLLQLEGGLPRHDGQGMRTLGGTFFALVRDSVGPRRFFWMAYTARSRRRRELSIEARRAAVLLSPVVQDWVRRTADSDAPVL
jgi:PHAX RNA-binding domain